MSEVIVPGATIGVLGCGQLGRMFALAARRMGYRVVILADEKNSPAGQVADEERFVESYLDIDAVTRCARDVDVVTLEFENIPTETVAACARHAAVHPGEAVLRVAQDRIAEKSTLSDAGLPVTPFRKIATRDDLATAAEQLGLPFVVKTARSGYDGKGQRIVREVAQLDAVWNDIGAADGGLIAEAFVDFQAELSVIGARNPRREFRAYGPIRNEHVNHILDISSLPGDFDSAICEEAVQITRAAMESLEAIGLLCVEFFLTKDDRLLINEIAPRPHNSGHLTIEACPTSQFEQQLRAICNLPLGETTPRSPAAMANLLGDLWQNGEPNWQTAIATPGVSLHLYGKHQPKPGRKMGHLTAISTNSETAIHRVSTARAALSD